MKNHAQMWSTSYDIIIVGAGVVGSSLAHALSNVSIQRSKPLRICLLERSLSEPDRIVGELLQPGGIMALKKLGLESCLEGIGAVPTYGYCVVLDGKPVQIPYPNGHEGRGFHHGRFIQALREKAKKATCVEVVEATVSELIECPLTGRILGVRATRKLAAGDAEPVEKEPFFADLTVVADGCFSNFRNLVMGKAGIKPATRSHFVGVVLEDANLPIDKHGTVVLVRGQGPVLLYQIAEHETRMLVDLKEPVPSDIKDHILTQINPQLPSALQVPVERALANDRIRRMPNSWLPPAEQGGHLSKEGVILVGDSWNMRHPLTGGGMTVAFNDVVLLTDMLVGYKSSQIGSKSLVVALYDLFGAEDPSLEVLRVGCFKYFELGGNCIREPVTLLAAIEQAPFMLFRHFFAVALYSIWVLFTHPRQIGVDKGKPIFAKPRPDEYPLLFLKSVHVFWTACVVFLPLMWTEIRP
ncbi:Squalene monooxygenase [Grifola frondosa]|uniref:Squalene monooxygenase n=1 Tax=Grifola frondosa TaxID=5627 RepID=A0A1C7MBI8_GRIFR|nr:Squalene monooxygenase [Grifola frondosa]